MSCNQFRVFTGLTLWIGSRPQQRWAHHRGPPQPGRQPRKVARLAHYLAAVNSGYNFRKQSTTMPSTVRSLHAMMMIPVKNSSKDTSDWVNELTNTEYESSPSTQDARYDIKQLQLQ